jgi:hypothetical protein
MVSAATSSGSPSAVWTTDLTHLGQNIWTVSYGAQTKLVYALAEWGGLAALDSSDGHIIWQTKIAGISRGVLHEEPNPGGIPLLVISGLVGLNAKTGAAMWNASTVSDVKNMTGRYEVDVRFYNGKVVAYSVASGKIQWSSSVPLLNTACGASMSPKGDIVAVSTTAAGPASHPPSELILLNGTDGTLLSRQSLGSQYSCSGSGPPIISESKGVVLVPTYAGDGVSPMNTGALIAFNSSSGQILWSAKTR